MRHATVALLLAAIAPAPRGAGAVEVEPVYQARLLGGQYFFGGDRGSLSGNVAGTVAPGLRFNERWALLPSLTSSYQGTKTVLDLVGAGSIFQEQMDHRVGVKAIYGKPESRWRFKPSAAFRAQLLKETKDEDWGSGLFDYRKYAAGMEVQYVYQDPFSVRFLADYFFTSFPNYTSLESKAGVDLQGGSLARELSGTNVLDTNSFSATTVVDVPLAPGWVLDFSHVLMRQTFPNQGVVDETGAITAKKREDHTNVLSVGVRYAQEVNPDLRLVWGLSTGGSYNASSQHSYDARRTRFLRGYYNYGDVRMAPALTAAMGDVRQPITASLGGMWSYRRYTYRPPQDAAGEYLGGSLDQHTWAMTTSMAYPMAPRFRLLFEFQYGRSYSNMQYQQAYAYDYTVADYLFGFAYDY